MRSFTVFISLVFLSVICYSQKEGLFSITSGIGVNEIKLGMSEKEVLSILKEKPQQRTYKEQLKEFYKDTTGYSIESIIPFVIGFDNCIVYEDDAPDNYPIFNLYFLNHKLNYITVTAYGIDSNLIRSFALDKELLFYQSKESCMEYLGCNYIDLHYREDEYDGNHLYYNRGLEVIYDDQKLMVICIFTPDNDLPSKMVSKKDQLIKEFRSIDSSDN